MRFVVAGLLGAVMSLSAWAQTTGAPAISSPEVSQVETLAKSMPWEYGVLVQGGNGLTENRNGFHFLMAGVHAGKVLTPQIGHGRLQGNFEYAVEVLPYWQSFTPKFQKQSCFATPVAGTTFVWTNHKYPAFGAYPLNLYNDGPNADASVWNFTPQGGVGFHYFVKPRRSVDFSANAVHISSASLGDKNPGVNASVQFSLGYTWWK
jgi:hypothetical protein